MIEFLQIVESVLFLAIAYQVIKLSPLLESAAFINGQDLQQEEVQHVAQAQVMKVQKPVRHVAAKSHSRLHHSGMPLAH
ncbi:MAG: hypothetical protein R8K49_08320 [Mariprofundaceae bacterium]